MTTWVFRTLIVPSDYQQFASTLASTLGDLSGQDMFTVELSANGNRPATSYVSTGQISATFVNLFPLDIYTSTINFETGEMTTIHTRKDGDAVETARLANEGGMTVTTEQIINFFNALDITEQEPFTAFARLNLRLVQKSLN